MEKEKAMRSVLLPIGLCVALCANAAEEPIGRLFFTPQERSQLDRLRQSNGGPVDAAGADSRTITVNGLVQRSSGKDAAWINSSARNAHDATAGDVAGSVARAAPAVAVKLPSGRSLSLKAGQTYDPLSGRVSEPYENPSPAGPESSSPDVQGK
jgi:hypothetical protein